MKPILFWAGKPAQSAVLLHYPLKRALTFWCQVDKSGSRLPLGLVDPAFLPQLREDVGPAEADGPANLEKGDPPDAHPLVQRAL